jgi:hypothetical protein
MKLNPTKYFKHAKRGHEVMGDHFFFRNPPKQNPKNKKGQKRNEGKEELLYHEQLLSSKDWP